MQGLPEVVGRDIVARLAADDEWRKPFGRTGADRIVRQVRPWLALGSAQEGDTLPPLDQGFGPGQAVKPDAGDSFGEEHRCVGRSRHGERGIREQKRPEAAHPARDEPGAVCIEGELVTPDNRVACHSLDVRKRQRGSQQNTGIRGASGQFPDRQVVRPCQAVLCIDARGAAVGEKELARPTPGLGDPLGEGEGQKRAGAAGGHVVAAASVEHRSRTARQRAGETACRFGAPGPLAPPSL